MMLHNLRAIIAGNPLVRLHIMLPDGSFVPAHFHVTEVGLVRKDFIDCGGTVRSTSSCVIQIWVADDLDHRLDTTKLGRIFQVATRLFDSDEIPVEVEYESGVVSQYPLREVEVTPSGLLFELGTKHTACLAPDRCGLTVDNSCCGTSNCC